MKGILCFILGICVFSIPLEAAMDSASDHLARVYSAEGKVQLMKMGHPEWQDAQKGAILEPGDQILTGPASYLQIVYDDLFLNIARIEENTKAVFNSIEPTELDLEDGTIYNALDGLSPNSSYQIATPTAVAAVRGTHFDAMYDAATETASFATLPTPDDAHESAIVVTEVLQSGEAGNSVEVQEGLQINLEPGQTLGEGLVKTIDPERLENAEGKLQTMTEEVRSAQEPAGETEESAKSENEKTEETEQRDDEKPGSNPPGDNGPGESSTSQNGQGAETPPEMRSEASDQAADQLIPEEANTAIPSGTPEGGTENQETLSEDGASQSGTSQEGGDKNKKPVYSDAVASFVGVGLGSSASNSPDQVGEKTSQLLGNMGVQKDLAEGFGAATSKYAEMGGDLANFQNGMPADMTDKDVQTLQFLDNLISQGGDLTDLQTQILNMDMSDPSSFLTGELAKDITQDNPNGGWSDPIIDKMDEVLDSQNPFYMMVLTALEYDLSNTEKLALISSGDGAELLRTVAVLYDLDSDSLEEQIVGVRYFNNDGIVHGEYKSILDSVSEGGGELQAEGTSPYLIVSPDACNPSDPEGVCGT